ncbi:hypothetical protein EB118_09130 [bacterium]|nr:hypothetical protein [bacterium]NBX98292.1 hypothetical protein [bacterium]NDC94733.1 hypothetical protein [bacterium]NDD84331.1 hypothetical protein [bacterium]NDG30223.1 hypothetical protein [bacterium]
MSKKQHTSHIMRLRITIIVLLVAFTASFGITTHAYIDNSKKSKALYDILLATDAAGGDVEQALRDLRTYIYNHMNTTIGSPTGIRPPIQLKGTYDRLLAAEQARVKQVNDDLYAKAQIECERLIPKGLSGGGRVSCITEYVSSNTTKEKKIPESLYKFDFVAPFWSADTAGLGIVVTVLLGIALMYNIISYRRLLFHARISS